MKNLKGYIVLLALATAIGCGVWWQAGTNLRLREEQARLAAQVSEANCLKALRARQQAAAVSAEELQKLDAAAAEAASLRERIEKLKEMQSASVVSQPKKREERWRNLGQATPRDTLQSVVWAAMGGEVDALVTMLAYDADSRAAADALFAAIPPESRALFPSADKLVATFIAGCLPTNIAEAKIVEQTEKSADTVLAKVRLQRSSRSSDAAREVTFRFQRTGADWRLVVPTNVISEFNRSLGSR